MAWHLGGVLLHSLHESGLFSAPLKNSATCTQPGNFGRVLMRTSVQRLGSAISVADMAAQVYVSPSHFHVLFKRLAGSLPTNTCSRPGWPKRLD